MSLRVLILHRRRRRRGDRFRRNVIEGTRVENVLDIIKRAFSYTPPDLLAIYYYLFSILIVILVG